MSLKVKLTSLITTFILLCSLLTVGVFAVKNTTFNVGGKIEFNVQGIEATITRGECTGFTADKTIGNEAGNILSDITLNNDMSAEDVADAFASWSGLNLAFDNTTTATIKLTITNTADEGADNYIDITALVSATNQNNARINVVNDTGGITALLAPKDSASFTITFSVIDDGYSASLNGFSVNFDMQKKVKNDFPVLSADMTYQTLKFRTIDGQSGLSVEDIGAEDYDYQSTGDLIIPAYVNNGGIVCPVTTIAVAAFGSYDDEIGSSITNISIPNTITSIGYGAFACCRNLTSITIPDSVTSIGYGAFSYCGNLTSVTIGNSVTSIGESAFYTCRGLTSVVIGNGVTSIGFSAFRSCSGLTSVVIPNSVTSIGDGAFAMCDSLTSITIPDSVTSIGAETFFDCGRLTSITIPDSVDSIGDSAFYGCSSLTTVNYTGTEEQWNALLKNIGSYNDALINATLVPNYKG